MTEREATVNWTSPALAVVKGKPQIITSCTHLVKGYDGTTGKELWMVKGMQQQCIPTPIVDGDKLYTLGGRSFSIWTTDGRQVYDSGSDFERSEIIRIGASDGLALR